jgi:L-alanine-DL-glutamate epimerase-like enolase superfamily enzyme
MTRAVRAVVERWPLTRPFAISRGTKTEAEVVVVEIEENGVGGRGECVPYPRYGETAAAVLRHIEDLSAAVAGGMDREALGSASPAGAARNALDCALWDLEAKQSGLRVWDLAGLGRPAPVITAETIGLDTPEEMARAAAALSDRPLLKIKLGADGVVERVRSVRDAAPRARLVVDANEGWDVDLLARVCGALADLGVEMIEQPLPAGDDAALAGLSLPIALCADESCHTAADLPSLSGRYRMVNIKLDKTGGLTEGLRLARAARDAGFTVMVGCMVGTSLAMAPATLLGPLAHVVDLDGPLWLKTDRQPPLRIAGGWVDPPDAELWG